MCVGCILEPLGPSAATGAALYSGKPGKRTFEVLCSTPCYWANGFPDLGAAVGPTVRRLTRQIPFSRHYGHDMVTAAGPLWKYGYLLCPGESESWALWRLPWGGARGAGV